MQQAYMDVLPKRAIGEVLAYSIERWKQLMIYTTDGKLNIDNNPVEHTSSRLNDLNSAIHIISDPLYF
jgi:hypothetical protein